MRIAPCYDCCSRCEGCHSICDLYKEYRATKDRIQEEVLADSEHKSYVVSAIARMKGARS